MPSMRGRIFHLIIEHFVGARFKRAGNSVEAWRDSMDSVIKFQKTPAGTEITPLEVNNIPAEWLLARGAELDRTILYFHGGAFMMGSPLTHRELTGQLSFYSKARILVLDYRLAPEYPFPASLQDALSAYRWLLNEGCSPEHIVFGGDSAGGTLALQTLLCLRDEGSPLPAGAFLLSPVTDWIYFDGESYATRAHIDPWITLEMSKFTAGLYVGENDPETPLLSPVRMDLSGLPPLCIHVGDHEVLLSDSTRLAERAQATGVEVQIKVWPGMWHVFQSGARFVPEARQSLEEIGRFAQVRMG